MAGLSPTAWVRPPDEIRPGPNRVDIWRVFLDLQPDSIHQLESTLSTEETERAARFHFDKDRTRFVVAHGYLRDILARYLSGEPHQLHFPTNEYGKPSLISDSNLEFNLSHSGRYALIAVTHNRKVGIDVEHIRQDIDLDSLARRFFSPGEVSKFMALPTEQKISAFFNCWTRKEAYIKAQGLGLSLPLDSFDVSLAPNEPAVLHATRPLADEALRWTLLSLDVHPDYAGALAVEGGNLEFRYLNRNFAGP